MSVVAPAITSFRCAVSGTIISNALSLTEEPGGGDHNPWATFVRFSRADDCVAPVDGDDLSGGHFAAFGLGKKSSGSSSQPSGCSFRYEATVPNVSTPLGGDRLLSPLLNVAGERRGAGRVISGGRVCEFGEFQVLGKRKRLTGCHT